MLDRVECHCDHLSSFSVFLVEPNDLNIEEDIMGFSKCHPFLYTMCCSCL